MNFRRSARISVNRLRGLQVCLEMHADLNSSATRRLLTDARQDDRGAFDALMARHEPFLRRFVEARFNAVLNARVSPSDVVQETQFEAFRRLQDFLVRQPMPFRLWLRHMALERLIMAQRQHLAAQRRSILQELPWSQQSSLALTRLFLRPGTSPSGQMIRQELVQSVHEAVADLAEADREILLMRTVEALSNQEVAQVLGIEPVAASQRYGRALLRLRKELLKRGVLGPEG